VHGRNGDAWRTRPEWHRGDRARARALEPHPFGTRHPRLWGAHDRECAAVLAPRGVVHQHGEVFEGRVKRTNSFSRNALGRFARPAIGPEQPQPVGWPGYCESAGGRGGRSMSMVFSPGPTLTI